MPFLAALGVFMPFYAVLCKRLQNFLTILWKRFQNRKFDWQNGVSLL